VCTARDEKRSCSSDSWILGVPKTVEPVVKLLRAVPWLPFEDLKPRFCSVLALVSGCFGSVSDYRAVGQ